MKQDQHDHCHGHASHDVSARGSGETDHVSAGCQGDHQSVDQYICPMHPEVVANQPGDCPKCGMHLVPVVSDDPKALAGHDDTVHDQCHEHEADHNANHEASTPVRGGKYDKVPAGHAGAVYTCPMHPTRNVSVSVSLPG